MKSPNDKIYLSSSFENSEAFLLLSLLFINQLAFGAGIMINHCKKWHMVGSLKINVHNLLLCPPDVKRPLLFQKTMFCNDRHSHVAVFIQRLTNYQTLSKEDLEFTITQYESCLGFG